MHCDRGNPCGCGNAIAPKIRRKRISRGVQHDFPVGRERNVNYFFLNCFRPRCKEHRPRETEEKRVSVDKNKFNIVHEPGNQVRPERSGDSIDEEERSMTDADTHGKDNSVSMAEYSVIWEPDENLLNEFFV